MKILQVQFKNRNGHTLRGIVTLPDTEGKVPFVVHLHGFAGSCSGYKSMYTHLSRALAAQGIGSARFDFYGNGESDGEFEDMSFDGLHLALIHNPRAHGTEAAVVCCHRLEKKKVVGRKRQQVIHREV